MLILIATIVETWLYLVVAAIIAVIIITSPSSQLRQETLSACNYSLLVVASRKAPFT